MAQVTGRWTWDAASGYYYNELYRWYYDATTGWYYGGEPVAWTQQPATLPAAARWENAPREGGPAAAKEEAAPSTSKAAAAAVAPQPVAAGAAGAAVASTAGRPAPAAAPLQRAVPAHPMQNIGGYQAPLQGRIGGAKGVGNKAPAAGGAPGSSAGSGAASDKVRM